ncbi:S41 family peptidase [Gemmatimonas sp.]|uniref:S41 family peptidase n=1 Tax=Gemmatimonas sp. TaxID=1962908 RepID=UPI003DA3C4DF
MTSNMTRLRPSMLAATCTVAFLGACIPGAPAPTPIGPSVREVDATVRTIALPPAPDDPEPQPAASDSGGIARLVRLSYVWHLASLHHPAVAVRGAPLDSAFIRAVTLVRRADNAAQLELAYTRFLAALNDPLTRVERDEANETRAPLTVTTLNIERTRDSILILQMPSATRYEESAAVGIRQALAAVPSRVVLDLRTASAGANADSIDAFVARTQLVERLASVPFTLSGVRVRRVGGAREQAGAWTFDDAWLGRDGALVSPINAAPRRVVVLANGNTVLPRGVLGLLASGRATLVGEEAVHDDALVPSVRVALGYGLSVRLRTGELLHADGSSGIVIDTLVGRSALPTDSAPAMRAAVAMLRSGRFVRASRLAPVRARAALPGYYDADPYPYMGARVLGGARVWSLMRARHAHRDLYDDDIDALFERAIGRYESARSASEYASTVQQMVSAFDDAQVAVRGASIDTVVGVATLPFRVRWADGRAIITDVIADSVTRALGIVAGQELTAVDGYPVPAWMQEHRRTISAPNDWSRQQQLATLMPRGNPGASLVRVRDVTNKERQLNVPRRVDYMALQPQVERPWQSASMALSNGVAYIDVNRLTEQTVDAELSKHRGARALIVDLRGALADSSRVADVVLRALREREVAVVARELHRYQSAPCLVETLRESAQQCPDEREVRSRVSRGDTSGHYAGRLVALVDERTSGAMERLALTLEATTGVTFVGTATAGSPAEAVHIGLPGGLTLTVPTAELRRTDGGQWQRVGLTPVVEARLTPRSYRSGADDVVTRAQEWLVQQLDGRSSRRQ